MHIIAMVSVAIGLTVMIVSFLVLKGFQETVKDKIFGFSGHLVVTKFTLNNSVEEAPMDYNIELFNHPERYPAVRHVQEYAHKTGLIKTDQEVLGVVLKGVGRSYDTVAFADNLVEGTFPALPDSGYSSEVLLSRIISSKLKTKVGDRILVHFFQDPPRSRRLTVSGIYETNLSEYYDSRVIIGDIRLIQRLNDWADSIAGGLEVFATDAERIDEAGVGIGQRIDYDLNIERVSDRYIQVFEWLHLLSRQVNLLLAIILGVICLNMISIVLILVMERTQMVGILKALGGTDSFVRSIFIYSGMNLVLRGMVAGNVLGLGLCYLQQRFEIMTLNAADYYMSVVPVSWHWEIVLLLNLITFLMVSVVLLLPTMIIARINPIKAIRFD